MGRKVATIVLVHDCDEDPCHLESGSQAKWIKQLLPLGKLEWNWKLLDIKVYDVRTVEDVSVTSALEEIKAGIDPVKEG